MILISHRGNIKGRIPESENSPEYVDNAILLGYEVEVDVWLVRDNLFLGHDKPQHLIDMDWIDGRSHKLWVHCKNVKVLELFNKFDFDINYFWHEGDTATLTSKKFIWAYPGKQPIENSIAVMPEINNDTVDKCIGICSDYIEKYKN
jgi:hypothetical protein